jgi:hypothetical protein
MREINMDITTGTRTQRAIWAIVIMGMALYCDRAPAADRASIQAFIWTFGLFSLLFIELRKTLLRPRQALIAVLLMAVHLYGIYAVWHAFPFESFFTIIIGIVVETICIGVVYIRLGQSIDPEGPFGLSEAEKQARRLRPQI